MAGGALPEHAQQERGKQRRIHKAEDKLQRIHDVVEVDRGICCRDRQQNSADRSPSAHRHVVPVAAALVNVGLVEVVGKDGIEGRDVAGHAAHEAGQQRRKPEAENAGGEIMQQHIGRGHVVVKQRVAAGVEHGLAGDRVDLGRHQAAALLRHFCGTTVVS